MRRLYGRKRAEKIIRRQESAISEASRLTGVPENWIRAILLREITLLDVLDPLADLAVILHHYVGIGKRDSSTGYAQIFGRVAIQAANFVADQGFLSYAALGIESDHRLDPDDDRDLWKIWRMLNRDRAFNIRLAAVNLLHCAFEMTGRIDCDRFGPEEMKLIFTRYNANIRSVTRYGETVYRFCRAFQNDTAASERL